jgi:signal transduction histidine kinase
MHGAPDAVAHDALFQAWQRVRDLGTSFWLALPRAATTCDAPSSLQAGDFIDGAFPYADIALETTRALACGTRGTTPIALALLAAFMLQRVEHGAAALKLGEAALELAAREGGPQCCRVRAVHAGLILPYSDDMARMATSLLDLARGADTVPPALGAHAAGTAFVAGTPLPELTRQLETLQRHGAGDAAAVPMSGLAMRLAVLHGLLSRQPGRMTPATVSQAPGGPGRGGQAGDWLAHVQACWYFHDGAGAREALERAEARVTPLTPVMDRLLLALFGVLVLAGRRDNAMLDRARRHCDALRVWADRHPASGRAMLDLAAAAYNFGADSPLVALCGFEAAAAGAASQRQHWIAALAWEQAARLAQENGLASAVPHYRRQALASYRAWGAFGRVDALRASWDASLAAATEQPIDADGRAHRIGAVGALGLSIAHEVNQPLAAITLNAAAARQWLNRASPDIERAQDALALIASAARDAGDMVRSIRRLATKEEHETHDVDVDQSITEVLRLLRQHLRRHGVEVECALDLGACPIRANRVQLQQVVMNLVMNAIEALAHLPQTPRRIRVASHRVADRIEVSVADNGPGILDADRERLFTRLFSTKPDNSGMGLSISRSIIRAHGGDIRFEPCIPHGACFVFYLPIEGSPTATSSPST